MSNGQYYWQVERTWILYNEFNRGHNVSTLWNPMSILALALLSMIFTVAHMASPPPIYLSDSFEVDFAFVWRGGGKWG